jgi:hypothetical protein
MGDGWRVPPTPAAVFKVNEKDARWVDAQCKPQSLASLEERIQLTGGLQTIRNITHVLATGFTDGSPFPACHERAKTKGWRTVTINSGHDAMLDRPDEVTALLLEYARLCR